MPPSSNPIALQIVRAARLAARTVIGRFLRNGDVMWMTLLHRGRAHHNEAAARAQFLDVPCPAIPHTGPQSTDQLIDERSQRSLVRHPSLDAFGHEFVAAALGLAIAVL